MKISANFGGMALKGAHPSTGNSVPLQARGAQRVPGN